MSFRDILRQRKSAIVERWFRLILETYPPDASQFLQKQSDQFANPVGHTISRAIEELYDGLVECRKPGEISAILDQIVRIRAVQDFSPAEAVGFVFSLKEAIKEEMKEEIEDGAVAKDLMELESRIDEMALLSFDVYVKCREKIYEIRVNEVKNRTFRLLERAGLVSEIPETEENTADDNGDGLT